LGKLSDARETALVTEDYERTLREVKCGLYIAKSNIPNAGRLARGFQLFLVCRILKLCLSFSGFGTYTAVDIPAGGLLVGSKLPAVPALRGSGGPQWQGSEYVWSGDAHGASYESLPFFDTSIIAGLFGALANAHTGITNMVQAPSGYDPLLDRRIDPGAGGFSAYDCGFRSAYPVAAGEELFVSYGEQW
jgi:hypothetical protein